jgi:DNA-binding HxlR family transcriptional regulator
MSAFVTPTEEELKAAQAVYDSMPYPKLSEVNPELTKLVMELIGSLADKWTMVVLATLEDHGQLRFGQLAELVTGISQKMLTKTIRQMERDGLVQRTVYPVIPPKVEYKLTDIGVSLCNSFCSVWLWAAINHEEVEQARQRFEEQFAEAS